MHILEKEAAGTVPVEAFSSTEKALAESLAEVKRCLCFVVSVATHRGSSWAVG